MVKQTHFLWEWGLNKDSSCCQHFYSTLYEKSEAVKQNIYICIMFYVILCDGQSVVIIRENIGDTQENKVYYTHKS